MTDAIEGVRLSSWQRRLWRLQETRGPLTVQLEAELRGPLDLEALEEILGSIVERHDALRTTFRVLPGMRMPVQDVGTESQLAVHVEPLERDHYLLTLSLPALCGDLRTLRLILLEAAGEPYQDEPLQYWQYSEWLNEVQDEASPDDLSYWEDPTTGRPASIPLVPGGADERLDLDPAVLAAVRRAAAGQGVPLSVYLLAVWTLLLQRHLDEAVRIGVVVDGRELDDLAATAGAFTRALPVSFPWRESLGFAGFLREAAATLDEAVERQRFFALEPSFPALFEHRPPFPALQVAGTALTLLRERAPIDGAGGSGPALLCVEGPDSLGLEVRRGPGLLARFAALLETAAANPETPVGDLDLLPAAERLRLTAVPAAPPAEPCVHHRLQPGPGPALAFGSRHLSHAEMLAYSSALAARLRGLGVGPEDRVGLCVELGPAAIVGMLGIWGAGGAWVPIDPHGPAERQAFFLGDSDARVVVTEPSLLASLADLPQTKVAVDLDAVPESLAPITPVEDGALPGNLAYVLYTSGSTGTPKGVAVEHRQLSWYLSCVDRVLFGERVRSCPLLTPPTFDAFLKQALVPLLRGETVWGLEREGFDGRTAVDPTALLAELAHRRRVGVNGTPTLWRAVLDEIERAGSAADLGGVTRVFLGGERLPPELFARTTQTLPGAEIWNLYGPTEATANATAARLVRGGPVVVGRPLDGVRVLVLDRRGNLVPSGVTGEVCLGGPGVSRGYLGRPALTAERFVPDPFSGVFGERLYRTGDLGRLNADGDLELQGRIDHQVKLRGFRIELGEIEARLERHPEVREAVVAVQDDDVGPRLVAFVVPERGSVSAANLRAVLREALPEPMVPSAFVVLDRLPRRPGGKVDRAALPSSGAVLAAERTFVAPRTPTERRLAEIWTSVLGRDELSVDDNFFELGGHSIQSIQISHRAIAAGLPITPRDLLHHPTVAELAALADATGAVTSASSSDNSLAVSVPDEALLSRPAGPPPYPPMPVLTPAPEKRFEPFSLSEIQQAYLIGRTDLFELGGVGPTSYLEADWPDLDVPRLEEAWRRLVERHDMLRSVVLPDGRWRVLPEVPAFRIGVLDLRGLDPEAVRRELATVRDEMSRHPFQPERWPLFEMLASRVDGGRSRLHVSRDLLIGDARSSEILLDELMLLYQNPAAELEPLTLGIRDYAMAVDALKEHEVGRQAYAYWRARLASLPPAPDLPISPGPGRPAFVRRHAGIEPESWSRLVQRAALAGLTPSVLLCAAFAEVLAVWSRGEHFSVNVLYSRRLPIHPQVNRLVGNFASTVLLEVDGREPTFELRAARLQERLWEDLQHGLVGGVEVLREANRHQGGSTRAAMPVVFSSLLPFAATEGGGSRSAGRPELVYSTVQTPQVALEMLVTEVSGSVHCTWNAVEEAFPPGFVVAMFEAWRGLVRDLADPEDHEGGAWRQERPSLVPPSQLARRREVNDTAGQEPGWLLHEPLGWQAELRPDEVAVVSAGRRLTFGELSRAADSLAPTLVRLGARPGRLVAVVLEKGWEQAVAVLAVLRAGAAYLPVDPALPLERRWFLLEHGEVAIALTRAAHAGGLGWPEGVSVVPVDEPPAMGDRRDGTSHSSPVPGTALAYVLFTSGSTGVPKGVMIEHRGAVNTVADVNRRFRISESDCVLALSSLSFDLSVWDLFGVLGAGGRVVMPAPDASRDPAHWHELVVREGVTVWNSVPALVELYVEHLERRGEPWPASLHLVMMSGDWIPIGLPDRIRALGSQADLVSLGGATEASIWSILFPIGEVDPAWKSIPYGRPMVNQTLDVLDERMSPCPDWVPGQLYIGGAGVARGYWKDEVRTRASFPADPRTGARLYRTGDLGRWLPDGTLELLGREDLQVKIQGYRVEPGEIEAALARHPGVKDAVVTAVGEARGHKRLVAFYVAEGRGRSRGRIEAADLRAWLEARLPAYMVPLLYVPLDSLPLTANGKVDRKALPSPDAVSARNALDTRDERFVAPRTPTEQRMAGLWESVLGIARVGLDDELFELGGDSMLALRLLAETEKAFGRRLPLAAFFQEATVGRLSALLDEPGIQ